MASTRRRGAATRKARARPSRTRIFLRRAVAVLCVLAVGGLGYVVLFTSLLGVRDVEVTGLDRVDEEEVVELARIPDQRPMLRVDTDEVAERVVELEELALAEVSRSWPSTISIEVVEREPVAYFPAFDGTRLVDEHGVPFHEVDSAPAGLPELDLDSVSSEDDTTSAVMAVLTGLPKGIRESVEVIGAESPGSIEFELSSGETVRWGDREQMERKVKVVDAILSRPGEIYDVSSPELPTVS